MQATKRCPRCQAENPGDIRFCFTCGYNYASDQLSPAPSARATSMYPELPSLPDAPRPPATSFTPVRTVRPFHPSHEQSPAIPPERQAPAPRQLIRPPGVPAKSFTPIPPSPQYMPQVRQPVQGMQPIITPHIPHSMHPPYPSGTPEPTGYAPIEIVRGNTSGMRIEVTPLAREHHAYSPGLAATGEAAERWRTSWRNRQRAAAGPATEVSRGQSRVPQPLVAMQHSLMRMRAIVLSQNEPKKASPGFWITVIVLLGLIGLCVAYIISTYPGLL